MAMRALRDGASNGIFKYFLLGILVLAGGGLVFTDVGGFFRGGVAAGDVVKIGDQSISAQEFDRNLRANIRSSQMTPQQAYQFGFVDQLLQSQIRSTLALKAADKYGVRLGKEKLAEQVRETIAPLAQSGQNPKDILLQILASRGMSEGQFLKGIAEDLSTTALSQTLEGGFAGASDKMIEDLARLNQETRSVKFIQFKDNDFELASSPSEETLQNLYDAQIESFAIAERRSGQLLLLKTDALKKTIDISDEELRAEYEDNIEAYTFDEVRSIEQALLISEAEAKEVAEKASKGSSLKDALKEVTKNTTDFIKAQEFEKADLPEELREPVFTAKKSDIVGPIETGLGYQVIKVTSITPPRTDSFEKISKALKEDLMTTRILDAQFELANTADDLLASGMTAEEIAEEVDVEIKEIPSIDQFGFGQDKTVVLKDMAEDSTTISKTLFELAEGEASPILEFSNGRSGAVILGTLTPKSYRPFDEVKAALEKQAIADQKRADNRAQTSELRSEILLGEKTFDTIGGKKQTLTLSRSGDPKAPFTEIAKENIFEAPINEPIVVTLEEGAALAMVTEAKIPAEANKETLQIAKDSLAGEMRSEVFSLFIEAQNRKNPARINEALLKQLYGQQQDQY